MIGLVTGGVGALARWGLWVVIFLFSRPGGWAVALLLILLVLKFGPAELLGLSRPAPRP